MKINLKPCPFCGGEFELVAINDNGNRIYIDDDYLADNPEILHSDEYRFGIVHSIWWNKNCPIATIEKYFMGDYLYDSIEEAIDMCNRRYITKTT